MMKNRADELRKKLEAISPESQQNETVKEVKPEPEPTPEVQPVVSPEVQPLVSPVEEPVGNVMADAGEMMNNLNQNDVAMLKQLIKGITQETKPEPEPTPEPEPVVAPESTEEENAERMQQINMEMARLRDNGAYRVEMIYQLLALNNNLERIAKALEDGS